jgi:hypothetical protein
MVTFNVQRSTFNSKSGVTVAKYRLDPAAASIDGLAWLAGNWVGERAGEQIEEQWSAPAAGAMMGMFRWLRGGQVWFYEFLTIEPEGDGLVFRIKHFNPGLVGWEEKDVSVTLDLVSLDGDRAIFAKRGAQEPLWLTYRRDDDRTITAYFEKESDTRKPEDDFRYHKQDGG